MENPCKIVCFGDSITRDYCPLFKERFNDCFPDIKVKILNFGIGGETSDDGLKRIKKVISEKPNIVIIGFGQNDIFQKISLIEYYKNITKMIEILEKQGIRVLLLNLHPTKKNDCNVIEYNKIIKKIISTKRIRLIDIYNYWLEEFKNPKFGLTDGVHQNLNGNKVYCKALMEIVPRRNTVVLWAYNGNPCECNYTCPYCSYPHIQQKGNHFFSTVKNWHRSFKNCFGNQHITFYFGHGEPMIGEKFFDIVEMIGKEPNWEMRIISNLSGDLERLVDTRVVREHRLNVNGSFHPTMIELEDFLEKLIFFRNYNIEVPVVYTLWPPFLKRFEKDFEVFDEHNFLVHVRRFRGFYKGKWYPQAYTDTERQFIAHYCDDATIKYMLNEELTSGKDSYTGMTLCFVDELGNVSYCDDVRKTIDHNFGNILQGTLSLLTKPIPFKPKNVSEGTVDGVSNIVELGYKELEGNHIIHFAKQGGVYRTLNGVVYKNKNIDFNDPKIRSNYNFLPKNLKDMYYLVKFKGIEYLINKFQYNYLRNPQFTKYSFQQKIKFIIKNLLNFKVGK